MATRSVESILSFIPLPYSYQMIRGTKIQLSKKCRRNERKGIPVPNGDVIQASIVDAETESLILLINEEKPCPNSRGRQLDDPSIQRGMNVLLYCFLLQSRQ